MEDTIDEIPEEFDYYESKSGGLYDKFHWKIRSKLIQKEDMK